MYPIKLSISIVVYGESFSQIKDCLVSLCNAIPKDVYYEITIVDNGTLELNKNNDLEIDIKNFFVNFPIYYVVSPKNGGYGYGHNQVIFKSNAEYHLILNNDVYLMPDTLQNAFDFMRLHQYVGMLVPDVYDMNEKRVHLCRHNPSLWISFLRRFAPNFFKKIFRKQLSKFEMQDKNYNEVMFKLSNPTGCFMFCRLDLLKRLRGFDEKFFMYYDDSDLGRRMASISQIAYAPTVKIKHIWRRAAYQDKRMAWIASKSALYYSWKWLLK
ncbi:MAG: glycosyltransferase [Candidatus Aquirickettsiella sp.]